MSEGVSTLSSPSLLPSLPPSPSATPHDLSVGPSTPEESGFNSDLGQRLCRVSADPGLTQALGREWRLFFLLPDSSLPRWGHSA
jgi:hypothetical protein